MALLFMDGQAHYDASQLSWKYSEVVSAHCVWSIAPEGRYGNAIRRIATSNDATDPLGHLTIAPLMTRTGIWPITNSGVLGFALKVDDLQRISDVPAFLRLGLHDLVCIAENGFSHLKLGLTRQGTFVLRGRAQDIAGAAIILAQSAEGIQSNSWAYIECKWVIAASGGSFQLHVNGMPLLSFTGDTNQQGTSDPPIIFNQLWTTVSLLGVPSSPSVTPEGFLHLWMCDLYLADLTGGASDVKDFLGDGIVATIFPNGPGVAADWSPQPGPPNWDQVNDKPTPDGDSTYVRTTAIGTRDVYTFEDIPIGSEVLGAHLNILARKEEDGGAVLKPIVNQAGVDYLGPEQGVGGVAYDRYLTQPYDLNPATGARWTWAEINNGQFGMVKTV
jgi:hypothetical protein